MNLSFLLFFRSRCYCLFNSAFVVISSRWGYFSIVSVCTGTLFLSIFRICYVDAVLDFNLIALLPTTQHLCSILKHEQTLSVLETILKLARVLAAIIEHESAVSVHLIVIKFTDIDSHVIGLLIAWLSLRLS